MGGSETPREDGTTSVRKSSSSVQVEAIAQQVSVWTDVMHDMKLNKALIPAYLIVSVLVVGLLMARRYLIQVVDTPVYLALLVWVGATGYITSFIVLSAKALTRKDHALLLAMITFLSATLVYGIGGYFLHRGELSPIIYHIVFPGVVCGMMSATSGLLISKVESYWVRVQASVLVLGPASLATILSYGYFAFVLISDLDPMLEVLIGGVGYPLAVALVGKILVCDFASYLVHFACKIDYVETVDFMVCFMRILLFMNLQAAVFMLDSLPAFVLALTSNISIELLFLPFNVKVATLDNFQKFVMGRTNRVSPEKKESESGSKTILKSWFTFNRLPPEERFCRHYYNEAMAEKVSLVGVIAIGFTLHLNAGHDSPELTQGLIARSFLIVFFEFVEDLSKRRLLWHLLKVNMSELEVIMDWKTNVQLIGFVVISVSFLLIGESLSMAIINS